MFRSSLSAFVALTLSLGVSGAHAAPKAPAEPAKERPCKADAERLCKDVKPGQGRVAACLKAHEKDLSPACVARIQTRKAARMACKADRETHCADVKGRGKVRACLMEHRATLSPACGEVVDKRAPKP